MIVLGPKYKHVYESTEFMHVAVVASIIKLKSVARMTRLIS